MRAQALLERNPKPTEQELRTHMEPNLCRCGTHMRILAAVRSVAGLPPRNPPPPPLRSARDFDECSRRYR